MFSRLSRFSCFSSLREGRCPEELAPALDLDMEKAPRPLFDGDDLSAVKAPKSVDYFHFKTRHRRTWLVHSCTLTAALLEDNGAAEFVEPLSIETRSVNGHCVLLWGGGGGLQRVGVYLDKERY